MYVYIYIYTYHSVSLLTLQFNSISFNHIIVPYRKMMTSESIKMIIQLF